MRKREKVDGARERAVGGVLLRGKKGKREREKEKPRY